MLLPDLSKVDTYIFMSYTHSNSPVSRIWLHLDFLFSHVQKRDCLLFLWPGVLSVGAGKFVWLPKKCPTAVLEWLLCKPRACSHNPVPNLMFAALNVDLQV